VPKNVRDANIGKEGGGGERVVGKVGERAERE